MSLKTMVTAAVIAGGLITGTAAPALATDAEDGSRVCSTFYDHTTYQQPGYVQQADGTWKKPGYVMGEDCKSKIGGSKYKAPTKASKSPQRSSSTTNGQWPSLDRAIQSGDRAAIQRAIKDKGQSPAYHDRVVSKVRQSHPELADRYGF
jgi:hypothetical protein